MSMFSRFKETRTTRGMLMNAPIDLVEFEKIANLARQEWGRDHPGEVPGDDVLRVSTSDDKIMIHWTDSESIE